MQPIEITMDALIDPKGKLNSRLAREAKKLERQGYSLPLRLTDPDRPASFRLSYDKPEKCFHCIGEVTLAVTTYEEAVTELQIATRAVGDTPAEAILHYLARQTQEYQRLALMLSGHLPDEWRMLA